MKVLVIPDVHLKPYMFERASELIEQQHVDRAVCLMDIADNWGQEFNLDLYIRTYDSAISFARTFPSALWCAGNHDICYLWGQLESGYSWLASQTVCEKVEELIHALPSYDQFGFVHRIDNVLFSHAGLSDDYVRRVVPAGKYDKTDLVIDTINSYSTSELWNDYSPIWIRPQYSDIKMYKPRKFLQVVGHTPVTEITKKGNLISCDTFSTHRDGRPVGPQEFLFLDTETWEYQGIK